jgi:hypothetical protein
MYVLDSRRKLKVAILESAVVKVRKVPSHHGVTHITAIGTSGGVKLGADLSAVWQTWLRPPWEWYAAQRLRTAPGHGFGC